jgi:ABC-type enterochelin transport system permease subunit
MDKVVSAARLPRELSVRVNPKRMSVARMVIRNFSKTQ